MDEYDYLLMSIGRLVTRVDEKSAEAIPLLRQLLLATADHGESARTLQASITSLRSKLDNALTDAWRDRVEILQEAEESGGLVFGGDAAKLSEAKAATRPVMSEWKGLGVLGR